MASGDQPLPGAGTGRGGGISGIHHVSLLVADTARALTFYRDLLGLGCDPARPDLGYPGAWLQVGGQQIHLLELPSPDPRDGRPGHGGRDRHLALLVHDLDRLRRRLEQAGVPCTPSSSGRAALFCRDPDGNALEFIEAGT
ncbi:MAG TPA: glyoxalase [Sedimenticola thiotaurini]|uniref:Glyoxalase n=1 Tax=Sedimenticola thiotaurini TaxID=1543721 RepID=A0A831RKI0_9GAMM|nr:glyoxalase [Sedimenticola thiotaurini]